MLADRATSSGANLLSLPAVSKTALRAAGETLGVSRVGQLSASRALNLQLR
jgi:hypothetical protein